MSGGFHREKALRMAFFCSTDWRVTLPSRPSISCRKETETRQRAGAFLDACEQWTASKSFGFATSSFKARGQWSHHKRKGFLM